MSRAQRRGRTPSRTGDVRDAHASDRKSLALCHQVKGALDSAIGADCRDEAWKVLIVVDVWPDSAAHRLLVWLRGPVDMDRAQREHIERRLAAARGFLRAQVAAAIHRKRTPELAFELLCGVSRADGDLR